MIILQARDSTYFQVFFLNIKMYYFKVRSLVFFLQEIMKDTTKTVKFNITQLTGIYHRISGKLVKCQPLRRILSKN